ncbi:hypothetical protein KVR01_008951 [Diaporthe batatas]|uniref:uncharacterized protein n=1 Tax=Diaporthe batatas TaxID=748121 RepID=UPI001D04F98C|nr:uncharacterized protein KVR01_008951 [Diaporthe batatas]KAG8160687.1 hypothetical protein KVR01_008951 [Diaporthe batatas]
MGCLSVTVGTPSLHTGNHISRQQRASAHVHSSHRSSRTLIPQAARYAWRTKQLTVHEQIPVPIMANLQAIPMRFCDSATAVFEPLRPESLASGSPERMACVLMSASRLVGHLGSEVGLALNRAGRHQILSGPGTKISCPSAPTSSALDARACSSAPSREHTAREAWSSGLERRAQLKSRQRHGRALATPVSSGGLGLLTSRSCSCSSPSSDKGCALGSARGSGAHVGVVQTLLRDAVLALQVRCRNSEHALSRWWRRRSSKLPRFSSGTPLSRRRNHHREATRMPTPSRGPLTTLATYLGRYI